nr:MAG TPA: hypothetical protein [Caudoviricetes sp.]
MYFFLKTSGSFRSKEVAIPPPVLFFYGGATQT